MIFVWLRRLWRFLMRGVFPPPREMLAKAERNARCPVCGAQKGRLRCVEMNVGSTANATGIFCQHTCAECGARWYENPVVKVSRELVGHAIPRNEVEAKEDAERLLGWSALQK